MWDENEDPKEPWALERLACGLLEKGALEPLSKKYVYLLRLFLISVGRA